MRKNNADILQANDLAWVVKTLGADSEAIRRFQSRMDGVSSQIQTLASVIKQYHPQLSEDKITDTASRALRAAYTIDVLVAIQVFRANEGGSSIHIVSGSKGPLEVNGQATMFIPDDVKHNGRGHIWLDVEAKAWSSYCIAHELLRDSVFCALPYEDTSQRPHVPANHGDQYYIHITGAQKGPYVSSQVFNMWSAGSITSDALYWKNGLSEWRPVAELIGVLENDAPSIALQVCEAAMAEDTRTGEKELVLISAKSEIGTLEQIYKTLSAYRKNGYIVIRAYALNDGRTLRYILKSGNVCRVIDFDLVIARRLFRMPLAFLVASMSLCRCDPIMVSGFRRIFAPGTELNIFVWLCLLAVLCAICWRGDVAVGIFWFVVIGIVFIHRLLAWRATK